MFNHLTVFQLHNMFLGKCGSYCEDINTRNLHFKAFVCSAQPFSSSSLQHQMSILLSRSIPLMSLSQLIYCHSQLTGPHSFLFCLCDWLHPAQHLSAWAHPWILMGRLEDRCTKMNQHKEHFHFTCSLALWGHRLFLFHGLILWFKFNLSLKSVIPSFMFLFSSLSLYNTWFPHYCAGL